MPWPDFLDSFAPDLKEGLEEVRATPRSVLRSQLGHDWRDRAGRPPTWIRNLADGDRESVELVVRALHDLHRALVEPRWDSALVAFHAEVARRIPMLAAGGHEELFGSLHPRLRWRDNGLDRTGFDGEWDLHGLGMVLMPSAFWTGDPLFGLGGGRPPDVLIYAARPRGLGGRPPCATACRPTRPTATAWRRCSARPGRRCCGRWPRRAAPPSWPAWSGSARPRPPSTPRSCATCT